MDDEQTDECKFPGCREPTQGWCDGCDTPFCDEHGSLGGDRRIQDVLQAVPSVCWKCNEAPYPTFGPGGVRTDALARAHWRAVKRELDTEGQR